MSRLAPSRYRQGAPRGGGGSRAGLGPSPVSVDAASLRIILVLRSLDRSALYLTRSPIFPTDKCKASLTAADRPPDHANHSVHSQLISPTGCLDSVWTCTRTRPNLSCPSEDLHVSGVPVKTRVPVPPSTLARSLAPCPSPSRALNPLNWPSYTPTMLGSVPQDGGGGTTGPEPSGSLRSKHVVLWESQDRLVMPPPSW